LRWFGGAKKPEGRRGDWAEERLVAHLLGGLQRIEKEEECSDIENREEPGSSKSQTSLEREGVAIERIERTAKDLGMAHKKGQKWIWIR
jgi:hypothetical protein